jgi:hypothetical protein
MFVECVSRNWKHGKVRKCICVRLDAEHSRGILMIFEVFLKDKVNLEVDGFIRFNCGDIGKQCHRKKIVTQNLMLSKNHKVFQLFLTTPQFSVQS